jgi:octaprenyl-diphosphate synthase
MDNNYTQRLEKIEAQLKLWLSENPDENWGRHVFPGLKKVSINSIKNLLAPGCDMLHSGGKRWRPALMTLVCEAFDGHDAALPLVPLVELCHTASLIHDDIEDNSDERRGKPAAYITFGIDTAINSGSYLYFLASCCIDQYTGNNKGRIYPLWAKSMRKMLLGQSMDISWHSHITFIPSVDEYLAMCALKGYLVRFAAELGALAAGASDNAAMQAGKAAEDLGVGYQILGDVKNITTGNPGKMRGDDINEGKKSLPVLLYLHDFPEKREYVFGCLSSAVDNNLSYSDIEDFIQNIADAGIIDRAKKTGMDLVDNALSFFQKYDHGEFSMNKESCELIAELINSLR